MTAGNETPVDPCGPLTEVGTGVVDEILLLVGNGKTEGATESIAGIADDGESDDAKAIFDKFDGKSSN
jgi:hypothetical protein